jgi:hypothetical protein
MPFRIKNRIAFILLALFAEASLLFAADGAAVQRIEIKSCWTGLGPRQQTELSIVNDKGVYREGRNRINPVLVEALVASLHEPTIPKPRLDNLGVTPEWLRAHALPAAVKGRANFVEAAKNQQALYVKAFNDLGVMRKIIPWMFEAWRFDDYPSASVRVTLADGGILSADSKSWHDFMLPWKLHDGRQSFNADISRAVAALMPKKATNHERLAGVDIDTAIADAVMNYIEDDWNLLDVENKAGPALGTLRSIYTVQTAEINPYHHPEYGVEWSGNQPHETNLHALLRRIDFPGGVSIALVLLDQDGNIKGIDEFLHSAPKYTDLALSLPWLNDYIRKHKETPVRISYVNNASFGARAMQVFAADMHAVGKDELAAEIRAKQLDIALLITGNTYEESYWLVLPDKRIVLWRYAGPTGLLNWKPTDFPPGECSAYAPVDGGCVGAVFSADGHMVK